MKKFTTLCLTVAPLLAAQLHAADSEGATKDTPVSRDTAP